MNRVAGLRVSLLVSLGLVPLACGGAARHDADGGGGGGDNKGDTNSGGSSAAPGASSQGGRPSKGGASSAGTSFAGGGAGETSTGGVRGNPPTCTSPKLDPITGLVTCAEGYRHRERVVACEAVGGAPGYEPAGGAGAGGAAQVQDEGTCDDDSQCGAFELGYCAYGQAGGACASGCLTDQDCPSGTICICDATPSLVGGRCVLSNCGSDRDCAPGYLCATYWPECGDDQLFACQKATDQCVSDADCSDGSLCTLPGNSYDFRRCDDALCVGRPFLVADTARIAPITARADWFTAASSAPRLAHLTTTERAARAEHWTKMGQMEHASIAAFARFSLQLLALGAPSDLVEACTQALADETAHAKLCFGIASAYAGRAIGPGPLDVSRSLEVTSLADIVDLVVVEGCFGETSAALEALEAADAATDPVIVAAYSQIAADERRHAELAFRFVRWALEAGGEAVRARIAAAIATPPTLGAAAPGVAIPCLRALAQTCASA